MVKINKLVRHHVRTYGVTHLFHDALGQIQHLTHWIPQQWHKGLLTHHCLTCLPESMKF